MDKKGFMWLAIGIGVLAATGIFVWNYIQSQVERSQYRANPNNP
jgi:hypothetical protein